MTSFPRFFPRSHSRPASPLVPGDTLGLLPARTLVALIPRAASSIGVITPPSRKRLERSRACACATVVSRLVSRLRELRPDLAGRIQLRDQDTPLGAWARVALAPSAAICLTSTFCAWPTIASAGRGFVVESPAWPRVAALASLTLRAADMDAHAFEETRLHAVALRPGLRRLPNLTVVTGGFATFEDAHVDSPGRHEKGERSALSCLLLIELGLILSCCAHAPLFVMCSSHIPACAACRRVRASCRLHSHEKAHRELAECGSGILGQCQKCKRRRSSACPFKS